jgi:hypothetical protein
VKFDYLREITDSDDNDNHKKQKKKEEKMGLKSEKS